jgi:hypothetical protein
VSRLRASGVITADSTSVTIAFGEGAAAIQRQVGVTHRKFPNGGSWSFFVCPCGRRARTLRLHGDGRVVCRYCCGLTDRPKFSPISIERLKAKLYGGPARLNPREGRTIDRRKQLEASLKRALIATRSRSLAKALADA